MRQQEGIGQRLPRVFTISAGLPFLPTLADELLSGRLVGPLAASDLADTTIFLPTRRAGRALAALLAEKAGGRAMLLPRIVPLGDADEIADEPDTPLPQLPPAIAPLERRLILTRLVQGWAATVDRDLLRLGPQQPFLVPGSPADAVSLAADLEALMDALATENLDWDAIGQVVDVEYSRYFRLTLDFLRIAHGAWPAILAERGASDPARRRNAALEAEAERLVSAPPAGPVVAAGSTGSIPATARLLAAISRLPRGAVVLPGLDTQLDEAGWSAIGGATDLFTPGGGLHGHPQFLLRRLVTHFLGTTRGAVVPIGERPGARERLLSEIMRPADTTDAWAALPAGERAALAEAGTAGISVVEAADEREEALSVAIALRETVAEPGRVAALVTPDRGLARRVAAELGRWGIEVEDTAGLSLADSSAGQLARRAAEAAALDFQPAALLALLAHPKVTLGLDRPDVERAAAALEIGVLRGPAPGPGFGGLRSALALRRGARSRRDPLPRQRLSERDWGRADDLLARLEAAFEGFGPDPDGAAGRDLLDVAARHETAVARLADRRGREGAGDRADEALAGLFDDLAAAHVGDAAGTALTGRFSDYPAFFAALARDRTVPAESCATHRRVRILGLLEARLLGADRIVLGGLDETIWPPVAGTDAFLNRPMRVALGLGPPERRIGQTAHDFAQAMGTRDAVVTRARKRDGKPTVPSRFLERLRAFAGDAVWTGLLGRGAQYTRWAAELDRPRPVAPIARPAPRPGADRFPRRLSVTEIETLVRDPYAVYARHVLRLDPLDPLAVPPSAADRGTILHAVLARFASAHPADLPDSAEEILLGLGAEGFASIADAYPELHALWWPAFRRMIPAYLEWERERRVGLSGLGIELSGTMEVPLGPGDAFTLAGRADRIEGYTGGASAIVDFKSGTVPTARTVAVGFSPQLTLEAGMLMRGGFGDERTAPTVPKLEYVKLGGRLSVDPCVLAPPRGDRRSMAEIVSDHLAGLEALVRRYGQDDAGYLSRPYAQYAKRFAPYDHLARVAEWSVLAADADEAAP